MTDNMDLQLDEFLEEEVVEEVATAPEAPAEKVKTKKKKNGKKSGNGKKKKHKKKKSGAWFIVGMFLYAVVFLSATYFGLTFLWNYMEAYEASRPNNTVNAYMEKLTPEHIVDQCENITEQIDLNIMPKETARQIMMAELSQGVRHAKKVKECTDTRLVYVLRSGSKVIGEFAIEANEADEYGFTTWSVVGESFDMSYLVGLKQTITVPDSCTVTVNGVELDESYIIQDKIQYEEIKEYYKDYDLPCKVTYEAGPLLGEVVMVVTDEDGTEVTFDETTDWSKYYYNCSAEEIQELDDFAELFLERYVDFTGSNKNTRYKTYNALIEHVVAGSDLATRLKNALEGLQFGQSKGDEIVAINPHLYIRLGDKYLVDLTYEVDTTGKEGVVRTTTNARILMVKSESGLMTESIIIY